MDLKEIKPLFVFDACRAIALSLPAVSKSNPSNGATAGDLSWLHEEIYSCEFCALVAKGSMVRHQRSHGAQRACGLCFAGHCFCKMNPNFHARPPGQTWQRKARKLVPFAKTLLALGQD